MIKIFRPEDGQNIDNGVEYLRTEVGDADAQFPTIKSAKEFLKGMQIPKADFRYLWIETDEGERVPLDEAFDTVDTTPPWDEKTVPDMGPITGLDLATLTVDELIALKKTWTQFGYTMFENLRLVGMRLGKVMNMENDPRQMEYWLWQDDSIVLNVLASVGGYNPSFRDYEYTWTVQVYVGEIKTLPTHRKDVEPIRIADNMVCALSRVYAYKSGIMISEQSPNFSGRFVPGMWVEYIKGFIAQAHTLVEKEAKTLDQLRKESLLQVMLYGKDI